MSIDRVFLGWNEPVWRGAARWLRERYGGNRPGNEKGSAGPIVVLGTRNQAAVDAVAHELTAESGLRGPSIVMLDALPALLLGDPRGVASPTQALLTRLAVLRDISPKVLAPLIPQPPEPEDLDGWLRLARELAELQAALAEGGLRLAQVREHVATKGEGTDPERWEVLAMLQERYEQSLAADGLVDPSESMLAASARGRLATQRDIVLVCVPLLPALHRAILGQATGRVTALIAAPPSEEHAFDEFGAVRATAWEERRVALDPARIIVTEQPREQSREVGRIASKPKKGVRVTVVLGDPSEARPIERTLRRAGWNSCCAAALQAVPTRPIALLAAVAAYARSQRFDDFAALLRHCDIDAYLSRTIPLPDGRPSRDARHGWLTLLDRYLTDHLQGRLAEVWLGDPSRAAALKAVRDAIHDLLPAGIDAPRPLGAQRAAIDRLLRAIYPQPPGDTERAHRRALDRIVGTLRGWDRPGGKAAFTFPDALDLLRSETGDEPETDHDAAADARLIAWPDAVLDAGTGPLIVTGMNEGFIPTPPAGTPFLAEGLRQALGMLTARDHFAADVHRLAALHATRDLWLLATRTTADNDPLAPSRLLMTCDDQDLAARVLQFYPHPDQRRSHDAAPALAGRGRGLALPLPVPQGTPITQLPVTAFRDYIDCPYRFYLKHVLGLEAIDDTAREMDGPTFGGIAHEIVQAFAGSEFAGSSDAGTLRDYFNAELDRICRMRFGGEPPVAVLIQREQLRERLARLAEKQAEHVASGWRIDPTRAESRLTATIDVDGEPFTIVGRIDRIDVHDEHGYFLLDYKAGDAGYSPEETHRRGPRGAKEWVDLQLPLYQTLAQAAGLSGDFSLGYIRLPKSLDAVGTVIAPWSPDEVRSAYDEAVRIIRQIRDGRFWPPRGDAAYSDDFSLVCMEGCFDRARAIESGSGALRAAQPTGGAR